MKLSNRIVTISNQKERMMKHIAKHTLLFGAFAMLLSTMPMQAMEEAPADVQAEVGTKQGFFGRWTERAKNLRMKNLIKELNRAWKPFIACVEKGKEDCGKRAKVVRNIITSILALVAIAGVGVGVAAIKRHIGRRAPRRYKTSAFNRFDDELFYAVEDKNDEKIHPLVTGENWWTKFTKAGLERVQALDTESLISDHIAKVLLRMK